MTNRQQEEEAFVATAEGQLEEGAQVLADLEGQAEGQRCMPLAPCTQGGALAAAHRCDAAAPPIARRGGHER